jgi:hypothetical protein
MNKTHQLGQHLMAETIKRSRGRDKPYCVGDLPSDKYYVANLSPEYGSADREEFDAKTRPSSISLECQPESGTSGSLHLEFEFYVPSLPTHDEYQTIQERRLRAAKIDATDQFDDVGSWKNVELDEVDRDILYTFDEPFFRRGTVTVEETLSVDDIRQQAEDITTKLNETLRAEVNKLSTTHLLTTETIVVEQYSTVDLAELSEEEYKELQKTASPIEPADLTWDVRFRASLSEGELSLTLSCVFTPIKRPLKCLKRLKSDVNLVDV